MSIYIVQPNQSTLDISLQVYAGLDNFISLFYSNNIDLEGTQLINKGMQINYDETLTESKILKNQIKNKKINTYA